MIVDSNLCVGCRCCQLACSFRYHGVFNLYKAYVEIGVDKRTISFTEKCNKCGYCALFCMYGAIKVKVEEEDHELLWQ